jgi:hypothetical protein
VENVPTTQQPTAYPPYMSDAAGAKQQTFNNKIYAEYLGTTSYAEITPSFLQARNAALPPANCPPYMGGAAGARLANGKPVTARGHVKHIKAYYIY